MTALPLYTWHTPLQDRQLSWRCPKQTGQTAHPSVDGTHGVTIDFEILCAVFLDEVGHFCQVCHVLSGVRHLDITEAFDRNLGQLGLASICQLASSG